MVVCQFFLKGTCKFGNNCHNEHLSSNSGGFAGRPTFGQNLNDRYHFTAVKGVSNTSSNNLFGTQGNANPNFQVDQNTILQAFRKELQEWDSNKVWPLSCFAAQREQKCLPGLDDHSPEELRMEAYKYKEGGNFQAYVNGLSNFSNQVINRRNQLKTMSNDQLLQELHSSSNVAVSTSSSTNLAGANPFSVPSSNLFSTGFGGSTQPSTGFGGSTQPSTGLFGSSSQTTPTASPSIFGSSNQGGVLFSGNAAKSTLNNPFVSSSSGGLFTNNTSTTSSLFGSLTGANANPFSSNTSTAPSGGLFSRSTSVAAPSGGLFSTNTSVGTPSGGLFGSAASSASILPTPFGSPTSNVTNPFGGTTNVSTSGGLFSQSKSSGGLFGSSSTTQVITQAGKTDANPFLASVSNSQKPVEPSKPSPPPSNETHVYTSKLPQMTAADIKKFKAAKFVVGQIPTCPPPAELC